MCSQVNIDTGNNARTVNVVLIVEVQKIKRRVEWRPYDFISGFRKGVDAIIDVSSSSVIGLLFIYVRHKYELVQHISSC